MNNFWVSDAHRLYQEKQSFVIVTIIDLHGSSPRNVGSKMIVSNKDQFGSIGGGNLELKATELALEMLQQKSKQNVKTYNLSASLGQCCGGNVTLLLENYSFNQVTIVLFGAGHVGSALLGILQQLPYRLVVVESRKEFYEKVPENARLYSDSPQEEVADFPSQSYYIIMTHSHSLDLAICEEILKREDFSYLGIIGSKKKAARFKNQLEKKNYSKALLDRIYCPIGLSLKNNKLPVEIAVAVAGQLLEKITEIEISQ